MSDTAAQEVCPACASRSTRVFFELAGVPVQDGILWPTEEAARRSPIGTIRLAFCDVCGFIGNRAFEREKVRFEPGYDISLHHSATYREFVDGVAAHLVDARGVRNRTILEIACGNGDFLRTLCRRGGNRGVGFDPSLSLETIAAAAAEGVELVPSDFPEDAAPEADLVCCRHVLQSIPQPRSFLASLRRAARGPQNPLVYLETSNAEVIFRDLVLWTIIYETCSFYTAASLTRLLELAGFRVESAGPCFGGQYLAVEAAAADATVPAGPGSREAIATLAREIAGFEKRFEASKRRWSAEMDRLRAGGRRVAGWGAGGRAISFLNLFRIGREIPFVVDINPKRQGSYLPITAQKVVPPEFLREYRPEVVLITNPAFETEIREQVRGLGLSCEFLVL